MTFLRGMPPNNRLCDGFSAAAITIFSGMPSQKRSDPFGRLRPTRHQRRT